MNVIGFKETPEYRHRKWNDLIESKKSMKFFQNAQDERRREIAEMDRWYYGLTLSQYVN